MCRVYDVKREGYYSWRKRGRSYRSYEDEYLYDEILEVFNRSGKIYGSPKITEALRSRGYKIGKKRVARIMRENGLVARRTKIYRRLPGLCNFIAQVPNRTLNMSIKELNKVWVGDITYLKLGDEWRYLAVVMDKCSRKIVGWSLGSKRNAKLTWNAMKQALGNRKPPKGLIFHTDRGIEYRAFEFSERLEKRGITQSMNRPRRMNDNAFMESFFANFKSERIHRRKEFKCEKSLRGVITDYVGFYNNKRLHSSIGYLPPVEYERKMV